MQGVFLAAAELTYLGFVVSLTARNAFGADLLVTDRCQHAWSVQVKTNKNTSANFWLLNSHAQELKSNSHIYVFVALKKNERPSFLVVPNRVVAANVRKDAHGFYWFDRDTKWDHKGEGWEDCFGGAGCVPEAESPPPPPPKTEELGTRIQHTTQHD